MNKIKNAKARAGDENLEFIQIYKAELRHIILCCTQLAKAQIDLEVQTGNLKPAHSAARLHATENYLFQCAIENVFEPIIEDENYKYYD